MSAQDNHLKTGDGFFARVSPRLDAIEEVTVNSAAQDTTRSTPRKTVSSTNSGRRRRTCRPTSRPAGETPSPTPARPGTSPLPIFAAAYNTVSAANAGNSALYTGNNWTNTTFLGFLAKYNPNPGGFASTNTTNGLIGNATFRQNLLTAGYPANLFIANPDKIGGASVRGNGGGTRYDSVQVEVRRRLSHGLLIEGNYVLGKQTNSTRYSFRTPRERTLDDGPRHAVKMNWLYELPFGRGRRFGSNVNGLVDRIIGGWEFDGGGRVQSG